MPATLHLFSGKIASGKSTLAAELAAGPGHVLIAEDTWLGTLYADQMSGIADYLRCSSNLRKVMAPHVVDLLRAGCSVVLDFPANTVETRRWMRRICDEADADHVMHVIEATDALCLDRLHARNAGGDHPFAVTDEQFSRITRAYEPPTAAEGFTIRRHAAP